LRTCSAVDFSTRMLMPSARLCHLPAGMARAHWHQTG
jgi:hypothetical protein